MNDCSIWQTQDSVLRWSVSFEVKIKGSTRRILVLAKRLVTPGVDCVGYDNIRDLCVVQRILTKSSEARRQIDAFQICRRAKSVVPEDGE